MRALVVGAGAVGQVYARHLLAGGAAVSFLVKPKHAGDLRAGMTLYRLNRGRKERTQPETITGFGVLTDLAAVAAERWDQVYLTVSSTALRAGDWFAQLVGAIGGATLVLLQPGPRDRAFVLEKVPASQVVQGTITVVSYHAPLAGETRFPRPGVAYWFGPFVKSPMSGPPERLAAVLTALRRGGLPARRHRDVAAAAPFPTALLIPLLGVLEEKAWSFRRLRAEGLDRAAAAAREALAVTAAEEGRPRARPPLLWRLAGSRLGVRLGLPLVLALAPRIMPLDVEAYLAAHFTKVGDQSRDFLRQWVEGGQRAGLPVPTLTDVTAQL